MAFLTTEELRRWARTFRLIRHLLEFSAALLGYCFFRMLSVDAASALGGRIGRSLGPLIPVSGRARRNLMEAFPDKSTAEIENIVRGMWENFGRSLAEYPHFSKLRCYEGNGRVEVQGEEILDRARDSGQAHIFFSGHLANLEIPGTAVSNRDMPMVKVYRAANNPLVDRMLLLIRKHSVGGEFVPKGNTGAREMIAALREGSHLGILVDQKMNDGIAVPFFGRDAMTAPALAQLALKSDRPIVPLQIERLQGAYFRVTAHPLLEVQKSGDRETDIYNVMVQVNATLETWIRQRPEQWFWLHNRWGD